MFTRNLVLLLHICILLNILKDFQQRWLNMKKSSADSTTTETMEEVLSGFVTSCSNLCLTKAFCVAVIFTKNTARCRLQKLSTVNSITMIEADSQFYEVQFESSDRKICKSPFVIQLFSSTTKKC